MAIKKSKKPAVVDLAAKKTPKAGYNQAETLASSLKSTHLKEPGKLEFPN